MIGYNICMCVCMYVYLATQNNVSCSWSCWRGWAQIEGPPSCRSCSPLRALWPGLAPQRRSLQQQYTLSGPPPRWSDPETAGASSIGHIDRQWQRGVHIIERFCTRNKESNILLWWWQLNALLNSWKDSWVKQRAEQCNWWTMQTVHIRIHLVWGPSDTTSLTQDCLYLC